MRQRPISNLLCAALLPLGLAACGRPAPPPAPPAPSAAAAPVALPRAALDRAELIEALDAAASDYAAGRANAGADLSGRRFAIRQAFGCAGPMEPSPGVGGWRWGDRHQTIEIALTPADWRGAPQFAQAGAAWEEVEGFWLPRPWLRDEGCPAARAATPAPAATDATPEANADPLAPPVLSGVQTAGLAAVFAHGGSRAARRDGKPFTFTLRGDDTGLSAPASGYRLVLEGRLAAFPDGGPIRCHANGPDQRPVCIAAAEVDRVAFEDSEGKLLREWRPS